MRLLELEGLGFQAAGSEAGAVGVSCLHFRCGCGVWRVRGRKFRFPSPLNKVERPLTFLLPLGSIDDTVMLGAGAALLVHLLLTCGSGIPSLGAPRT